MAIACLLVPAFPLFCELAMQPQLLSKPVALTNESRTRVSERTQAAERYGVQPGMTLREALGYCPMLTVLEPHAARQQDAARLLSRALRSVSPLVEENAPGIVYADLQGLEGLYPRWELLERTLRAGLPDALQARLGIADRKFTAYAAAHSAPAGGSRVIEARESQDFLAPQSVRLLPLDTERVERLSLLSLRTLGELGALPRPAVAAQFGLPGGWAWDAAHGRDTTPIFSIEAEELVSEALEAEPPLVSRDAVDYGMRQLLGRALRHPDAIGRFVRTLRLEVRAEDERIWQHRHVLKEPAASRETIWRILCQILDQAEYPAPVVQLSLTLVALSAESGRQASLFPGRVRYRRRLNTMVQEMKARYGASPVKRLVEVEPWSRIPERRYALMDFDP